MKDIKKIFNPPSRNSPPVRVGMDSEGSFASADFRRSEKIDSAGVSPQSFKKRARDAYKGDYGHALIVAGSLGMTGAAYLASEAALLAGGGLVTCAVPKSLNGIMASKLTEAMTLPVEDEGKGYFTASAFAAIMRYSERVSAVAIGPGLSQNPETKGLVKKLIAALDKPLVLDADGINNICDDPNILKRAKKGVVITPHLGEMSRLLRKEIGDVRRDKRGVAESAAKKYNAVVILKGAGTVVAAPGKTTYINTTGNPGMAAAGMGDVLTGIIAGLLGQGYGHFEAAKFGVYLHGLAGDFAAEEKGETSLRAQDVLRNIYKATKNS